LEEINPIELFINNSKEDSIKTLIKNPNGCHVIKKILTIIMPIELKKNDKKVEFLQKIVEIVEKEFLHICNNQYGVIIAK
jgi:hypothetical protein